MDTFIALAPFPFHILFVLSLGFYLITAMQWYSYELNRVIFHYKRPIWHILYFLLPILLYFTTDKFFWIYFLFAYLPSLYLWHRKQDKPLVWTDRVKRFFSFLLVAVIVQDTLCLASQQCQIYGTFLPLFASLLASHGAETYLAALYRRRAKAKLASMPDLKIVAITARH